MHIGIPKEIKDHEFRVGATPADVASYIAAGHQVSVGQEAGAAIGFSDADYRAAGARIGQADDIYAADLVLKVKEPQPTEYALLRPGQLLFCYLHLAAAPELARELIERQVTAIAFETITDKAGHTPLLAPMSEIAGRLAAQMAAHYLTLPQQGRGVLLAGAAGVPPARVLIIGGGMAGSNAAQIALGMGADVTLLDRDPGRLRELQQRFGPALKTGFSHDDTIRHLLPDTDAVIGAAYIPGRHAPRLLSTEHIRLLPAGAVLVDISIDQGGISETSRPTTHSQPVYLEHGVVHYCVANMPAAVARTSTLALTQAVRPYVHKLAQKGLAALAQDPGFNDGLNIDHGEIRHAGLAADLQTRQNQAA